MTQNTQNPKAAKIAALKEAVLDTLAQVDPDPAATMENQARALDLLFRHIAYQIDESYSSYTDDYRVAFRAQSQYRYTLKALRDHNNASPRKSPPTLQT